MNLNTILSVLGSLASLAAIPLSFYLYLRGKEARVSRIRREVVKTLSYQIGEGRELTLFTVRAVISSKLREEGAKGGSITVEEVVEDLVTETMIEPMLDPPRKDMILKNLSRLYHLGPISRLLQHYSITAGQLAFWIERDQGLEEEDRSVLDLPVDLAATAKIPKGRYFGRSVSTFFGLLSVLTTIIFFVISERELSNVFETVSKDFPLPEILAGAAGTVLASLLTLFVMYLLGKDPEPRKAHQKKEPNRTDSR